MDTAENILKKRKERIESRLKKHGITGTSITFLPYLEFDDKSFATPFEVGCRIMILNAIVYTIQEPTTKKAIAEWLKNENIWERVSNNEAQYLEGNETDDQQINRFSWQLEGAYILAWALGLVKEQPSPTDPVTDNQMDDFFENIAPLGDELSGFLNNLSYRNTEEIFEENIFYELTSSYFRDLFFHEKEDTTGINKAAAFERHSALNWLRRFSDNNDWDEIDTST